MSLEANGTSKFRSMVLSVSSGRGVLYANSAFCEYVGLSVEQVVGRELSEVSALTSGEVAEFFADPHKSSMPNRLLADDEGRVFELKTATRQGVTDVIFDEVSASGSLEQFLSPVSAIPFDQLGEDELRTVRIPDLRFITCCAARMKSASALAGKIPPLEHRVLTGAFLDETSQALLAHGCTLLPPRGSLSSGFSGAPRYHADHSLRALEAAFEQVWRIERVRATCTSEGRELPPISCGLASGNAIVGGFGSGHNAVYLAEGDCVETAERLSRIASAGEILVSQNTLDNLLSHLPPEWHAAESASEDEPDLSPYISHAGAVIPLENPPRLVSIGPAVEDETSLAVYRFEEVWKLDAGNSAPVSVFRATRLADTAAPQSDGEAILESGFVTRLGKYRLAEVIGSGGMGRVWKAQDAYGNSVAIKTLHTSTAESPDSIKRFRREAEIMSRIPHRNICRIFETGEHDGTHFLVMELVEGLTLSDILHADAASTASRSGKSSDLPSLIAAVRKNRSSIARKSDASGEEIDAETLPADAPRDGLILPLDQTLGLLERVCEAVEFAHQHGVLHRDLKPGNILLRADGDPLVADFGLAKLSGESGPDKSASLSLSGHVLGTVENMAPEQAESSKNIDARADVYALGTILYQMCTGQKHFTATGNFIADIQALQTHEPKRPRTINPSLDPDLEVIILKCLRTSPDERYRSVSALLADLQRFRRGEPIAARPVTVLDLTRKIIRRNRAASIIAGVSLVFILLLVTGSIWSLSHQLAQAQAARLEAETSRRLAEQKGEETQRLAKEAAQQAELANQRLAEITAAEARFAEKAKETEVERKKREEVEAAAAVAVAESNKNIERIKEDLAASTQPLGKAIRAQLLEPVQVDLIQNGRKIGSSTLLAGTEVPVSGESDKRVLVTTVHGDHWIDKNKVDIQREPTAAPVPADSAPEPLVADLTTSPANTPRNFHIAQQGNLYQATGYNGASAIFLITELTHERLGFDWRAPSATDPAGLGGSGSLDLAVGDNILEAGPIKVAWNNEARRLEYHLDAGTLSLRKSEALAGISWAQPLKELAKLFEQVAPPDAFQSLAESGDPVAPDSSPKWSLVLLDKPLHIGDDLKPEFANPRAAGTEFRETFALDPLPDSDLLATIRVAEMVPKSQLSFVAGNYKTKLLVNNYEVDILNQRVEGTKDSAEIVELKVSIPREHLHEGQNTFVIQAGADGKNHDDFELHSITLGLEPASSATASEPTNDTKETAAIDYQKMVTLRGGRLPKSSPFPEKFVRGFMIGAYEIKNTVWQSVYNWSLENGYDWTRSDEEIPLPPEVITWYDAVKWCNAKSEMEGLEPVYYADRKVYRTGDFGPKGSNAISIKNGAKGYRLPSAAEWEWAARGGVRSRNSVYSGGNDLTAVGWFMDNSVSMPGDPDASIGLKAPNELGLHDMSGNKMEYCWDLNGTSRAIRGGNHLSTEDACRVNKINYIPPTGNAGFRVARALGQ